MEIEQIKCAACGGGLTEQSGKYKCTHCGAEFKEKSIAEQSEQLKTLFGEALLNKKAEQIANLRRNLWEAIHEEYTDSAKIIEYCRELKKLNPDDFQANFYETANGRNAKRVNKLLDGIDVEKHGAYIDDIVKFMIKSLESKNVSPLKNLITRAYSGDKYTKYITLAEDEAVRLDSGIYEINLPRDVFLAYSSADMEIVNELTEYLESQKISCFVALRNLRHGRGAVENYEKHLEKAMHNCKCVVYISTENSRSLSCDALKVELPYIKENEPKMGRVEYLGEGYGKRTSDAAKILLEDFFSGKEYCRTKEDLLRRVLFYITGTDAKLNKKSENNAEEELARRQRELEEQFARKQQEFEEQLRKELESKYKGNPAAAQPQSAVKKQAVSEISATQEDYPTLEDYDKNEFEIKNTVLKKYKLTKKTGEAKIPQGVTIIGESAFNYCSGLTEITIPNSVTEIGKEAFRECSGLTELTISDKLIKIGECAFCHCGALENITVSPHNKAYYSENNCLIERESKTLIRGCKNSIIPLGIRSIGDYAFSGCDELTSVTIPDSVRSIGNQAFYNCRELTSIIIPFGVRSIGIQALGECKKLTNIIIPNSVTEIRDGAFWCCGGLTEITIPDSVNAISDSAFFCCRGLTEITIPDSVTSICEGAFSYCSGLKNITIPYSVTTICGRAFEDCSGLTEITIPNSVTYIGDYAFAGCDKLIISCGFKKKYLKYYFEKNWNVYKNGKFFKKRCKTIYGKN